MQWNLPDKGKQMYRISYRRLEQVTSTTMRRRGLGISGCRGSSSTESGVQWTPSMTVPSLMAIKCRLLTSPSITAIYLAITKCYVVCHQITQERKFNIYAQQ